MEEQKLLMRINEFIDSAIECKTMREKVHVELKTGKGFSGNWERNNDRYFYTIYVPEKLSRLTCLTRMALLHEIGHPLFNEMYYNERKKLEGIVKKMREKKWFSRVEKFYYWDPRMRKIKTWFGYSFDIKYGPNDDYDLGIPASPPDLTRGDSEFFCDYFAVFFKNDVKLSRLETDEDK